MKYNIAEKIWIINFINEGKTKEHFNSFETNTSEEPLHTINFEVVESIEPLIPADTPTMIRSPSAIIE